MSNDFLDILQRIQARVNCGITIHSLHYESQVSTFSFGELFFMLPIISVC